MPSAWKTWFWALRFQSGFEVVFRMIACLVTFIFHFGSRFVAQHDLRIFHFDTALKSAHQSELQLDVRIDAR